MVEELRTSYPQKKRKIRLFFQDEATFGRVSEPKYCWCKKGVRPVIHSQKTREYREIFGAAEPETGEFFYTVEENPKHTAKKMGRPKKGEIADSQKPTVKDSGRKSRQMNNFMQKIGDKYSNDIIVLVCDRAWWHRSQYTQIPQNLRITFIPPYTPQMNPIEQLWREIRAAGFANKYFETISDVETKLHSTIKNLTPETIMSIMQRDWIMNIVKPKVS